jgi:GDP-mannose 6-dehydrogenase
MRIGVFGLGYVGITTAACFATEGHDVLGVDVVPSKVDLINSGKTPIIEEKIEEIIESAISKGQFRATTRSEEVIGAIDLAIVCVGTPSNAFGNLETSYIKNVSQQIGLALRHRDAHS